MNKNANSKNTSLWDNANLRRKKVNHNKRGGIVIMFCLTMIVLVSANLHAQSDSSSETPGAPVRRLTPDEAVELAIKNNLSIESSRINMETKRRASSLAWNQLIPSITVAGVLNRNNEAGSTIVTTPVPGTGTPMSMNGISGSLNPQFFVTDPIANPQWNIIGNIQISLTLNAALFDYFKLMKKDYEAGVISYDKAKMQLERDVRKAYHNILLLQENLALMRGSFANVERQVNMAQANYNAGLAPELTVLQARVARENMRLVIDQVEN